jgi:hypothetical protein
MPKPMMQGLKESGYSLEQFKTSTGEHRVPVTEESQQETPLFVAGNAIIANEDLGETSEVLVMSSGDRDWQENYVGYVVMRSPDDEGKTIWIKTSMSDKWIGPLVVVTSIPNDQYYDWVDQEIVIAVDPKIGASIGIYEKGGVTRK